MSGDFKEVLARSLRRAGIATGGLSLDPLVAFYELLTKWQSSLNLTAIKDPEEIADRHFCESLLLLGRIDRHNGNLLDFGSGNGFPALPLKIAIPDLSMTLVESRRKKCHFLEAAIRELHLRDVEVLNGRFGRVADIADEKCYDYFTMRAVGNIARLLDGLPSIMRSGGKAFIYAGEAGLPELDGAAAKMGARRVNIAIPGRASSFIAVLENF